MRNAPNLRQDGEPTASPVPTLVYVAYALPALPLAALALPLYVIVPTFYSEGDRAAGCSRRRHSRRHPRARCGD